MLKTLAQSKTLAWIKSLDPKTRTATAEVLGLLLLLVIAYFVGCQHGKHSTSDRPLSLGDPYQAETWHKDTALHSIPVIDSTKFVAKGEKLANGHVTFHHTAHSSHGDQVVHADYDPETGLLIGTIQSLLAVTVPEVTVTHSISSVIPVREAAAEVEATSGWTWVGVGAALGVLLCVIAALII